MKTSPCPHPDSIQLDDIAQSKFAASRWRRIWLRVAQMLAQAQETSPADRAWARSFHSLSDLDAHLLDDIGVPAWLKAKVRRHQEARAAEIAKILTTSRNH